MCSLKFVESVNYIPSSPLLLVKRHRCVRCQHPIKNHLTQPQRCQQGVSKSVESTIHVHRECNIDQIFRFHKNNIAAYYVWFLIDTNLDSIDPLLAKIESIIGIDCEFYFIDPLAIEIDICNNRMGCYVTIDQILAGLDVCGIPGGVIFVVDTLIKMSLLISLVHVLTIIFDVIDLKLDKLSKSECKEGNINKIIIIITTMYEISIPLLVFIVGFLLLILVIITYLIMHSMDESLLHAAISIKFVLIISAIVSLISNLAVQSSIDSFSCDTQVVCSMGGGFIFVFVFFYFSLCLCVILY